MFDRLKQVEGFSRQIESEIVRQMESVGSDDRPTHAELQGLLDDMRRFEHQLQRVLQAREARWMQRAQRKAQLKLVDLERTGSLPRQVRRAENGLPPRPTRLG